LFFGESECEAENYANSSNACNPQQDLQDFEAEDQSEDEKNQLEHM
jgi:hypothetical protein